MTLRMSAFERQADSVNAFSPQQRNSEGRAEIARLDVTPFGPIDGSHTGMGEAHRRDCVSRWFSSSLNQAVNLTSRTEQLMSSVQRCQNLGKRLGKRNLSTR